MDMPWIRKKGTMKHLTKIFAIKIILYLFLLLIILILIMQTVQYTMPQTEITLENTTILGRILSY